MNFTTDLGVRDLPPRYDAQDILDPIVQFLEEHGHRRVPFDGDLDFVVSLEPSGYKTSYPATPRFAIRFVGGEPRDYAEFLPGQGGQGGLIQGPWLNGVLKALVDFLARVMGEQPAPLLDAGPALLEPITQTEHAAIERLLSILGEAQQIGALTAWQEEQIIHMADLIRAARNDATPGETPRSRVVPVVGAVLAYLFLQIPDGIVKWNEAIPILQGIGWTNTAGQLLGGG